VIKDEKYLFILLIPSIIIILVLDIEAYLQLLQWILRINVVKDMKLERHRRFSDESWGLGLGVI